MAPLGKKQTLLVDEAIKLYNVLLKPLGFSPSPGKVTTELLFSNAPSELPPLEDTLAIRQDWPPLLAVVDQTLDYLKKVGALKRLFDQTAGKSKIPGVLVAE